MEKNILMPSFFDRDAVEVACDLLGKVIRKKYDSLWLSVMIIETESYFIHDKASHASLGYTEKRKALFMPPGTIYMYYARGGDSLNLSCQGEGNAVLIKSGIPYLEAPNSEKMIAIMHQLNPPRSGVGVRSLNRLCSGQTLLCKSLGLKVKEWDQQQFNREFYFEDVGYKPAEIVRTTRLGIPQGRDGHLLLRFIDKQYLKHCTQYRSSLHNSDFGQL